MTDIPKGFIKMELELMFEKKNADLLEKQVLRNIVCGYYIYYSKKYLYKSGKTSIYRFKFYCNPKQQTQVAYHIGVFCQALMKFHKASDLIKNDHVVPKPFPKSIQVKYDEST